MVKRILIPIILILGIVLVFWGKLFFPEPKMVYTVEIIGSDIWNVYYPARDFLSQSLKSGELPFWNNSFSTGFASFAEGQLGTLYLPNLVLFYLFPTWLAWNLNIVLVFLLLFVGSYLFFRRMGLSSGASLFSGFSFSFSGYFVARIIHIAPLQTISLLPLLFWLGDRLWEKPNKWRVFWFATVFSQQIYCGHMQWVMITAMGLVIFLGMKFFGRQKQVEKRVLSLLVAIVMGIGLAVPQLLQTWEMRGVSVRSGGLTQEEVFVFPYDFRNLIGFVLPEYFGSPRNGTYSTDPKLGLYWENIAYMGILPLLFLLVWVVKKEKKLWEWGMVAVGALALLLALGQATPLHILMTLPILNNFRISARFLVLVVFAVVGLAGLGLDKFIELLMGRKKSEKTRVLIVGLVLAIAVFDVWGFASKYHAYVPVEKALEAPESAKFVDAGERVYTDLSYLGFWKKAYVADGWEKPEMFLYLKNSLDGNTSSLFGITNIRMLSGLGTLRQSLFEEVKEEMLDVSSVRYIITPQEMEVDPGMREVGEVEPESGEFPKIFVYENLDKLDRARLVSSYIVRNNTEEVVEVVKAGNFPHKETVILEKEIGESFEEMSEAEVEIVEDKSQRLVIETNTDKKAILVVADAFYPAWKAKVNGEEAEIIAANINQRAVVVPAGESVVEFWYEPLMFKKGAMVAGVVFAGFMIVVILRPERWFGKSKKK